jgi:hypothetical protein
MDDKEFDPTAAAELYGADETDHLWTGALEDETEDETKENRSAGG